MTPLIMTSPKKVGIAPTFYRLIHHRHQCQRCGLVHAHSEIFAMVAVGSGFNGAPCYTTGDLQFNIPIKTETRPLVTTPFCHMCLHPDIVKHLPKPTPDSQRPPAPSWVGMGLTQPKPDRPKSAARQNNSPKPAKKAPSIDDLDID